MADKIFRQSFKIVSAGDASQATVTSPTQNIQITDNIGIQVNIVSGSPTGTFDVQISGDHVDINGQQSVAGNWVKLGSAYSATVTAGVFTDGTANCYFDLNQLSSQYVRLLYTKGSGTGTFDAFIVGKGI